MAGFDDITRKAKALLDDEKVKQALKSEKAEEVSDKLLDGIAGAAKKITGGKHDAKIDEARNKADGSVGDR
ncbi:antitoxin [Herbiconiux sp. P18]|uniref:antitoxin n=1 Tax=Herbiconiux liangxiaofengii TaxID=3342795 RepID=UPI0035B96D76